MEICIIGACEPLDKNKAIKLNSKSNSWISNGMQTLMDNSGN